MACARSASHHWSLLANLNHLLASRTSVAFSHHQNATRTAFLCSGGCSTAISFIRGLALIYFHWWIFHSTLSQNMLVVTFSIPITVGSSNIPPNEWIASRQSNVTYKEKNLNFEETQFAAEVKTTWFLNALRDRVPTF